jgi:hypothetical protein
MIIKKNKQRLNNHCFVIMTGDKPKYLEDCAESIRTQTLKSKILIYTSKSSKKIERISKKFKIKLVKKKRINIAKDWNNALKISNAKWVTLVHDDDIYHKNFFKEVNKVINNKNNISIIFTNYLQIRNNKILKKTNLLLKIKKILLYMGFLWKNEISSNFQKKIILKLGSPIPCPSVTFNVKKNKYKNFFNQKYKVNLDWDCWRKLARREGSFYWIKKNLFFHRIHETSVTSMGIKSGLRKKEDKKILKEIWPSLIANFIFKISKIAYNSNK